MRKLLSTIALLLLSFVTATAQEGTTKIFVITTTAGVKCNPNQKALWIVKSGGSAGVYRCSAVNTLTVVGGGTTLTDSASLRSALSDETGSGAAVFATSPTFTGGYVNIRNADGSDTWLNFGSSTNFIRGASTQIDTSLTVNGAATFSANVLLTKTVTAGGTTGAQTINKNSGSVNFAAAASSLVVTNSLVDANSIIICTVATDDATATACKAIAGAGSFTLKLNAAATAETRVNFLVTN